MSTSAIIPPVELISSERKGALNGPLSSSDFNESMIEILSDLASLASFNNEVVGPLLAALSIDAQQPTQTPVGLQGSTVFSDTSDTSPLFYDASTGSNLVIADSIRLLDGILSTYNTNLTDLAVQVQTLQQRVSSTSLNDVALTLQNFGQSLGTLNAGIKAIQTQTTGLSDGAAKYQSARVTTGDVPANTTVTVAVAWNFLDDNYTVLGLEMEQATSDLRVLGFTKVTGTGTITVWVQNNNPTTDFTGTLHASARHD